MATALIRYNTTCGKNSHRNWEPRVIARCRAIGSLIPPSDTAMICGANTMPMAATTPRITDPCTSTELANWSALRRSSCFSSATICGTSTA